MPSLYKEWGLQKLIMLNRYFWRATAAETENRNHCVWPRVPWSQFRSRSYSWGGGEGLSLETARARGRRASLFRSKCYSMRVGARSGGPILQQAVQYFGAGGEWVLTEKQMVV
jgi:hypothetical protein